MSAFGKFIRSYPKLRIINLLFYPLLIYSVIGFIYSSLFTFFYSLIFWGCAILIVIAYLIFDYTRLSITLDTKTKQQIYFKETDRPALKNNSFTDEYKNWLIINADPNQIDLFYKPFDFNTGGECCICCCTSIILFLIITSFSLIYIQGDTGWIIALSIFFSIIVTYPILRFRSERKMHKLLDSEIKRILYEEETGHSPFRGGKFTFKYRTWLIQQARVESRLQTSY
ncbi:MAG: hypothetical protein EU535_07715 [Promethearchaeota archaeon]|nr:MAG: hypothetical protein EU535_07715 [Candidatus Lokiarchaeota archaeon]